VSIWRSDEWLEAAFARRADVVLELGEAVIQEGRLLRLLAAAQRRRFDVARAEWQSERDALYSAPHPTELEELS
jgi:hypothetical protein